MIVIYLVRPCHTQQQTVYSRPFKPMIHFPPFHHRVVQMKVDILDLYAKRPEISIRQLPGLLAFLLGSSSLSNHEISRADVLLTQAKSSSLVKTETVLTSQIFEATSPSVASKVGRLE